MKKHLFLLGLSVLLTACASTGGSASGKSATQDARENIDTAREGVYLIREIKNLFSY